MLFIGKLKKFCWLSEIFIVFITVLSCLESILAKEIQNGQTDVSVNVIPHWNHLEFTLSDAGNYTIVSEKCKIWNQKAVKADSSCIDLLPCTKYTATIEIKDLQTEEIFPQVIEQTETSYIEPQVTISEIKPAINSISLEWHAKHSTCITKFDIEILVKTTIIKSETVMEVKEQNQHLINDLDACQEYNIQLRTHLKSEKSNATVQKEKARTEYAEPGNVEVILSPTDINSQMSVSWSVPEHRSCIKNYQIEWQTKDCSSEYSEVNSMNCHFKDNISDTNAVGYIITDLQGCEGYNLSLFVNNRVKQIAEGAFESLEQAPKAVVIQSIGDNKTSIDVQWNPSSDHGKCIELYNVTLIGPVQYYPNEPLTATTTSTNISFVNLEPCGIYIVQVMIILKSGNTGGSRAELFIMKETQPTEVRQIEVKTAPHSMKITWLQPEHGYFCVAKYRISMWQLGSEEELLNHITPLNTIKIPFLTACQIYGIQIISVTNENLDGISAQVYATTEPFRPRPPQSFESIGNYSSALKFNASVLETDNNCTIMWAKFECKVAESNIDAMVYKRAEQYVSSENNYFTAFLSPLSPFTTYNCQVRLLNVAGWSDSLEKQLSTAPFFSAVPEDVALVDSSHNAVAFSFKPPSVVNGNLKYYLIHFEQAKHDYYRPNKCESIEKQSITTQTSGLLHSFDNLLPYTSYSIQVAATNQFGISEFTRPYILKTQPWVSEPILELEHNFEGPYEPYDNYTAKVTLKWLVPCQSNGEIEFMKLSFKELSQSNKIIDIFTTELLPNFDKHGYMIYNESDLRPEHKYDVTISVKVKDVDKVSKKSHIMFVSPAGVPRNFDEQSMAQIQVNALTAKHPTTTAVVRFPVDILQTDVGAVLYVALLITEKGCNNAPEFRYSAIDSVHEWPDVKTWNEVNHGDAKNCIAQYQATPARWKPPVEDPARRDHNSVEFVEFILGTEDCERFVRTEIGEYCNGPLKPETKYYLVIRLFTANGYSDATMLEFQTDGIVKLQNIIIGICSGFVLIIIAVAIYTWMARRHNWKHWPAHYCQSVEEAEGDLLVKEFVANYYEISRPEKVTCEFQEVSRMTLELSYYASEFDRHKNRYTDIHPYVKNRVVLVMDEEGSDYINASFIDGYRRPKEYIATQGPKPETVGDFWRMIVQYNVQIIVMVTQFKENNVLKCHEYYPYESDEINVTVGKKDIFDIYDRTEMLLTNANTKRKILHFFFKKWHDHGCPIDAGHLITFVRKVKAEKIAPQSPIAVHCSAGVGRTGTFIALDIIMQRLKQESRINIFGTVKKLRSQRMKMVQTQAQYNFLYACAYELCRKKRCKFPDLRIFQKSDLNKNSIMEKQTELLEKNGKVVAAINEPMCIKNAPNSDGISISNSSNESNM